MRAIGMTDYPEIGKVVDRLKMLDVAVPRPGTREVAVKPSASSMHIDEIYAAQGTALGRFYGPKALSESEPYILGSSVSGTIVALGEEVEGFKIGDDVIAIPSEHLETGSWATYRCIGVMVLQYLKSFDCYVTAVCSGANEAFVRELGADEVVPEIGKVVDRLKMLDVALPRPGKREVAVKLSASSMHIDEIYAAQGTALGRFYGPKALSESEPYILGSSVSGTIVALGEEVEGFKIGDDVIAIPSEHLETGSWATYRCIGVMVLQYLKSFDCYVTAVCSGANEAFVRELGADEVVDYTKCDFADVAINSGWQYDAAFDCVGGREIEDSAFSSLMKDGVFVTVVGPMRYIGEQRLSWLSFLKVMTYIGWRMVMTRLKGGPRYTFGAKYPRLVIKDAIERLLEHGIRMPVYKTIPLELDAVADAVRLLTTHRAKGRIVIDFGSS